MEWSLIKVYLFPHQVTTVAKADALHLLEGLGAERVLVSSEFFQLDFIVGKLQFLIILPTWMVDLFSISDWNFLAYRKC